MTLISTLAVHQAETEAALRQAKSASDAAQQLLKQQDVTPSSKSASTVSEDELQLLKDENKRLKAEHEATLKQAESVSREYDRLMGEHARLQGQGGGGDKKED